MIIRKKTDQSEHIFDDWIKRHKKCALLNDLTMLKNHDNLRYDTGARSATGGNT